MIVFARMRIGGPKGLRDLDIERPGHCRIWIIAVPCGVKQTNPSKFLDSFGSEGESAYTSAGRAEESALCGTL
jgi:hypothetical protein